VSRKKSSKIRLEDLSPKYREQALKQLAELGRLPHDVFGGAEADPPTAKKGRYTVSKAEERTEDGIVFDSKWEMELYSILKRLLGRERFELQPVFELQPAFKDGKGKAVRKVEYIGDFLVDGEHVIDAKGHKTEVFRLKEKLFIYKFKKPIHCINKKGNYNKSYEAVKKYLEGLDLI
jgi:hypothetical protein